MKISISAIFGALAIAVSIVFPGIPYPIAPFLKIDFSEIFDLMALFIGGWGVGVIVATIHFLGLMFSAEYIIGPPLKYIAVLSMYLGIYLSGLRVGIVQGSSHRFRIALVNSSIIRAIIMTIVNIFIVTIVAPEFYAFFEYQVEAILGWETSILNVLLYLFIIIGSYNVIQTVFAFTIAVIIYKSIFRYL